MTLPQAQPVDVRGVRLPDDLAPNCVAAFRRIEQAANLGEQIKQADIEEAMGSRNSSGSSGRAACLRLEARGLIRQKSYQKGFEVMIVETGAKTAAPPNTSPPWRERPPRSSMPSLSTSVVDRRNPSLADSMRRAASAEGLSFQDYLAQLIWEGWCSRQALIQSAGAEG